MERVTSETAGKRKFRTILIASMILLLLGTHLCFFWFQTIMVIETWYGYRKIPIAHMTPAELSDRSINPVNGTKISSFGYEFEVPWRDVEREEIQHKPMSIVPFRSGLEILVGHGTTHDLTDTIMSEAKVNSKEFRSRYPGSDYDFLTLALNTTPSQVRLLGSKQEVGRRFSLLIFKAIIVPGDSGIFKVNTPELPKHPRKIAVTLYSGKDNIEFTFTRKDMTPLTISQADINRVIQSTRESNTSGPSDASVALGN
jgi:hypothetical protein